MRREHALLLNLGCLLVLVLEAPAVLASVMADLSGPYPTQSERPQVEQLEFARMDAPTSEEAGAPEVPEVPEVPGLETSGPRPEPQVARR